MILIFTSVFQTTLNSLKFLSNLVIDHSMINIIS